MQGVDRADAVRLAGLLAVTLTLACGDPPRSYGIPIEAVDVRTVAQVVVQQDELLTHRIAVESRIESVCQASGCWCYLQDGAEKLYVTLPTFSLPGSVTGRRCRVEGKLARRDDRLTLVATGLLLLDG